MSFRTGGVQAETRTESRDFAGITAVVATFKAAMVQPSGHTNPLSVILYHKTPPAAIPLTHKKYVNIKVFIVNNATLGQETGQIG